MSLGAPRPAGADAHQAQMADGRTVEDTPWQHAGREAEQTPPMGVWVCQLKQARAVGRRPKRISTLVLLLLAITALGLPWGTAALIVSGVTAAVIGLTWAFVSRALATRRGLFARASWLYLGEAFAGQAAVERTNELVSGALARAGIQIERVHLSNPAEGFQGGAWHLKGSAAIFNEPAARAGFRRIVVTSLVTPDWVTISRAKGAILEQLGERARAPTAEVPQNSAN